MGGACLWYEQGRSKFCCLANFLTVQNKTSCTLQEPEKQEYFSCDNIYISIMTVLINRIRFPSETFILTSNKMQFTRMYFEYVLFNNYVKNFFWAVESVFKSRKEAKGTTNTFFRFISSFCSHANINHTMMKFISNFDKIILFMTETHNLDARR